MKKVNLGIILIFLAIIGVICYTSYRKNYEENEKQKIEIFLDDFYEVYNKYLLLDEEDRDINKMIASEKYENRIEKIKEEYSQFIVEEHAKNQSEEYVQNIYDQISGIFMLKKYNEKIEDINCYFYDNYVSIFAYVTFDFDNEVRKSMIYDKKISKYVGETTRNIQTIKLPTSIILKKVEGKYKIVYKSQSSFLRHT